MNTVNLLFLVILPIISFLFLSIKDIEKESPNREILFFLGLVFIVKTILVLFIFPFPYLREFFLIFYVFLILYFTKTEWGWTGLFFGFLISISFCYVFEMFKDVNFLMKFLFIGIDVVVSLVIFGFYFVVYFIKNHIFGE